MSWVTDPTQLSIRSQVTELDSGNTPMTSDITGQKCQRYGVDPRISPNECKHKSKVSRDCGRAERD
jgi:hypothetical protein